jgi:hypothetical protein
LAGICTASPLRGLRPRRGAAGDREAAKTADLNALATHQGVAHGVQDGFHGQFGVALVS